MFKVTLKLFQGHKMSALYIHRKFA